MNTDIQRLTEQFYCGNLNNGETQKAIKYLLLGIIDVRLLIDNDHPSTLLVLVDDPIDVWPIVTETTHFISRQRPEYSIFEKMFSYIINNKSYNKSYPVVAIEYNKKIVEIHFVTHENSYDLASLVISHVVDDVFLLKPCPNLDMFIFSPSVCVHGVQNA